MSMTDAVVTPNAEITPETPVRRAESLPHVRAHADIFENADAFALVVELPGVARDDLDVMLEKRVLTIAGVRWTSETRGVRYSRQFSLGEAIDPDGLEARLEHGVLTLTLPKAAAARARKIEVNV